MKKLIIVSMALMLVLTAKAKTGYWTGDHDGAWTDARNWKNGEIPGVGDTARFEGGLTGTKATVIDFTGVTSIANIEVDGGADVPVYTFGTDADQLIPLGYHGVLSVGVNNPATTVPTIVGTICTSVDATGTDWYGNQTYVTIRNENPTATLTVRNFGKATPATGKAVNSQGLFFTGEGSVALGGCFVPGDYGKILGVQASCRKLIIAADFDPEDQYLRAITTKTRTQGVEVEIAAGQTLKLPSKKYAASYTPLIVSVPTRLTGAGTACFRIGFDAGCPLQLQSTLSIASPVSLENCLKKAPSGSFALMKDGGAAAPASAECGYLRFDADYDFVGLVSAVNYGGGIKADRIGLLGEASGRLGVSPGVVLANGCALEYIGAGETTDKTIWLSERLIGSEGVLRHCGTGVLTYQGVVSQNVASATFVLDGDDGTRGVFAGDLAEHPTSDVAGTATLNFVKRGTGTWCFDAEIGLTGVATVSAGTLELSTAATLSDAEKVVLSGGVLELPDAASPVVTVLSPLELADGTQVIRLGKNRTLQLSALPTRSGGEGILDVRSTSVNGRLLVTGASGAAPNWMKVNGGSAVFGSDGRLLGADETVWTEAADGSWSGAMSKWSNGEPTVDKIAYVEAQGDAYNVLIDGSAVAKRLFVSGENAKVTVASAGSLTMSGTDGTLPAETAMKTDVLRLSDGATLRLDGGLANFSGFAGKILVGSSDISMTSRLEVVNGATLTYADVDQSGAFRVEKGGLLEISNSTVMATSLSGSENGILADGGEIRITGMSKFAMTRDDVLRAFGTGRTVFSGDAEFKHATANNKAIVRIAPTKADETAEVVFVDQSYVLLKDLTAASYEIGGVPNGFSVLRYGSAFNNSGRALAKSLRVGNGYGNGLLEVTAGNIRTDNSMAVIGGCFGSDYASSSDAEAMGLVRVAGGTFQTDGLGAMQHGWDMGQPVGLAIGSGTTTQKREGRPFVGRLELSSGLVKNVYGHLMIGIGYGEGTFVQTGGTVELNNSTFKSEYSSTAEMAQSGIKDVVVYATNATTVVGFAGGCGRLVISNGSFTAWTELYVGGAGRDAFNIAEWYEGGKMRTPANLFTAIPMERHDADGKVTIVGGSYSTDKKVVVGADGRGELEMIGTSGSFSCGELVLSNNTESVLSFRLAEAGVAPVVVNGKMSVVSGSKLKVDLSEFKGRRADLVRFASCEGAFDAADIEFVGVDEGARPEVRMMPDRLRCVIPHGLVIVVR